MSTGTKTTPRSLKADWKPSNNILSLDIDDEDIEKVEELDMLVDFEERNFAVSEKTGLMHCVHPMIYCADELKYAITWNAFRLRLIEYFYEVLNQPLDVAKANARNVRFQFKRFLGDHNPKGIIHSDYDTYESEEKKDSN